MIYDKDHLEDVLLKLAFGPGPRDLDRPRVRVGGGELLWWIWRQVRDPLQTFHDFEFFILVFFLSIFLETGDLLDIFHNFSFLIIEFCFFDLLLLVGR